MTCVIDLDGMVKVSFFGCLRMRSVREPDRATGPGIPVASLLDIAATKALTVQQRASAKDFIDMGALLDAGLSMNDIPWIREVGSWSEFQSGPDPEGSFLFR